MVFKQIKLLLLFVILLMMVGCGDQSDGTVGTVNRGDFSPTQARAPLQFNDDGMIENEFLLETENGSSVFLAAQTSLQSEEEELITGEISLNLAERSASELDALQNITWFMGLDVTTEGSPQSGNIHFGAMNLENLLEVTVTGIKLIAPLGKAGAKPSESIQLFYKPIVNENAGNSEWEWVPVSGVRMDAEGMAEAEVWSEGHYAFGRPTIPIDPETIFGRSSLYDIVSEEIDLPINWAKLIEEGTSELIWIAEFILQEGNLSEVTEWKSVGSPSEPAMGRLENYGRILRVRSRFGNLPKVGLSPYDTRSIIKMMNGPFPVGPDGQPSSVPIEDPYQRCDLEFAGSVHLIVSSRAGNYKSFKKDVISPLKEKYIDPEGFGNEVKFNYRSFQGGYFATVFVETHECTSNVVGSTNFMDELGVYVAKWWGRQALIIDERGGTPYVAVYAKIDDGKALGINFVDPFPTVLSKAIPPHFLGGPNHMLLFVCSMEYDSIHDQLWVIHSTLDDPREFRLFRYDHPIFLDGDRKADFEMPLPVSMYSTQAMIYLDYDHDRLYVKDINPGNNQFFTVTAYDNASTTPKKLTTATHYKSYFPDDPSYHLELLANHMMATEDTLYLFDSSSLAAASAMDINGTDMGSFPLNSTDGAVTFNGWASIDGEQTVGSLSAGAYDPNNNTLYVARHDQNFESSVYALKNPSSWKSTWIPPAGEEDGYWSQSQADYRKLSWIGPTTVTDLDIATGRWGLLSDSEVSVLSIIQSENGAGFGQVRVFVLQGNNGSGEISSRFTLGEPDMDVLRVVELINTPDPKE